MSWNVEAMSNVLPSLPRPPVVDLEDVDDTFRARTDGDVEVLVCVVELVGECGDAGADSIGATEPRHIVCADPPVRADRLAGEVEVGGEARGVGNVLAVPGVRDRRFGRQNTGVSELEPSRVIRSAHVSCPTPPSVTCPVAGVLDV